MNNKIVSGIVIATILMMSTILMLDVTAELYQDFDGRMITEEEYMQRVNICIDQKAIDMLAQETDCLKWALTDDAKYNWYFEYEVRQKAQKNLIK
jgi:hypothetical protein